MFFGSFPILKKKFRPIQNENQQKYLIGLAGTNHGRIFKWTSYISKSRVTVAVLHDGKIDVTSISFFGC